MAQPQSPESRSPRPARREPGASAGPSAEEGPPRLSWWRRVMGATGSFALVIGMAAAVKMWVADVYFIPTGSMETTLYGRPDGGDRIACAKFPFWWRGPRRWEVAVFRFPVDYAARGLADRAAPPDTLLWRNRRDEARRSMQQYRNQNYIKRFVGLPGETIYLFRGGVWRLTDPGPADGGAGAKRLERLVKPPATQERLWIPGYRARLGQLSPEGLAAFWRPWPADPAADPNQPALPPSHPAWAAWTRTGEGTLLARPPDGGGAAALEFMQRAPDGKGRMPRVDAVIDRYVVRQPVRFRCDPERLHPAGDPLGTPGCGREFTKTVSDMAVTGACPHCGAFLMEDAAVFHHRRTSLPANGLFADAARTPQREAAIRQSPYHATASLRIKVRVRLPEPSESSESSGRSAEAAQAAAAEAGLTLIDNGHAVTLTASAGRLLRLDAGGVSIEAPDSAERPEAGWHVLELHRADGRIRAFLNDAMVFDTLDEAIPSTLPLPGEGDWPKEVEQSGARLSAAGGWVEWDEAQLDRDIHYFAGDSREYPMMGPWGEIALGPSEYLALGDNPPSSYDSRGWGPVPADALGGTAVAAWWPPHRARLMNRGLAGR